MSLTLRPKLILAACLLLLGVAVQPARAAYIFHNYALPGTTSTDGWQPLNYAAYAAEVGGSPTYTTFNAAFGSNVGGSGDATLSKVSGPGYPAGGSVYMGGSSFTPNTLATVLNVTDANPVAGLKNIVFQVAYGPTFGYTFHNNAAPTLSYTANSITTSGVAPTMFQLDHVIDTGVLDPFTNENNIFENYYVMQWDLSAVTDPITAFTINFTGVEHAQLYALQLDQSSQFAAVPEPTGLALGAMGLAGLSLAAWNKRRRITAKKHKNLI